MRDTNGWALWRPLTRMRSAFWIASLLALSACCLGACGGKVVFQTGESADGGGGADLGAECVLACGDPCTKCLGTDCFAGTCSEDGICMPPEAPPKCAL
jgi:hypothetical protein